jgi:hypothetical protein
MKPLAMTLMLAMCGSALAADVSHAAAAAPVIATAQAAPPICRLPPVEGYWCLSREGNWFWIETGTGRPKPAPRTTAEKISGAMSKNFRPDSVNGIPWFRDGRSYFSD